MMHFYYMIEETLLHEIGSSRSPHTATLLHRFFVYVSAGNWCREGKTCKVSTNNEIQPNDTNLARFYCGKTDFLRFPHFFEKTSDPKKVSLAWVSGQKRPWCHGVFWPLFALETKAEYQKKGPPKKSCRIHLLESTIWARILWPSNLRLGVSNTALSK